MSEQQAEYKTLSDQRDGFGQWCILELMGHVKMAGYVTEEEHFGAKMGRIDVPGVGEETAVTQYFSGSSVYRLTPVTEEIARAYAIGNQPRPVTQYDLKQIEAPRSRQTFDDLDGYEDDDEF